MVDECAQRFLRVRDDCTYWPLFATMEFIELKETLDASWSLFYILKYVFGDGKILCCSVVHVHIQRFHHSGKINAIIDI